MWQLTSLWNNFALITFLAAFRSKCVIRGLDIPTESYFRHIFFNSHDTIIDRHVAQPFSNTLPHGAL